jgi:hypothetical protein
MTSRSDGFMAATICLLCCLFSMASGYAYAMVQKDMDRECYARLHDQFNHEIMLPAKCR